jgi:hypothetical protein
MTCEWTYKVSNYVNVELTYLFVCHLLWTRLQFGLRYTIVYIFFAFCTFIILHRIENPMSSQFLLPYSTSFFCLPYLHSSFSTLSLNLFFSEVKYKAFLRLLFGLTGVLSTSFTIVSVYDMFSIRYYHLFFQCIYLAESGVYYDHML